MQYSYTISHVPGKQLTAADTLSLDPMGNSLDYTDFSNKVDANVNLMIQSIPATAINLQAIREARAADEVCQKLLTIVIMDGYISIIYQDHFVHNAWLLQN